jgi:glycosyltransferase involved in cell wall biosynthesis
MPLVPFNNLSPRYVIISPVKDEERYVELTLRSVTIQTLKPILWIIVDDGSNDGTPEIISRYAKANSFIRLVRNTRIGSRKPGSLVIRAFNFGCQAIGDIDYDYIIKLDCDISFEPDYFQKLIGRLSADERLGIVSGVYLEMNKAGVWNEIVMPYYHAAGACKVLRRQCFEDIAGFIISAGWDTVDELRAMTRGWKTGHFKDLKIKHHKAEGSGVGLIRTSIMHGDIFYLTGGSKLFFLMKVFHRLAQKPYGLSALALLWGYIRAVLMQKPLLVTEAEAHCYKALLRDRLRAQARALLAWS